MSEYLNKPYEYFMHTTTENVLNAIKDDVSNTFAMLTNVLSYFTEVCISGAFWGGRDLDTMLPQLAAFAMEAVRLMPSVNRLSTAYNQVSVHEAALDKLAIELRTAGVRKDALEEKELSNAVLEYEDKEITSMIKWHGITYAYPETECNIFENADMAIPIGRLVGLIGSSGAGKTTAVDIILGLLKPQRGQVLVDDIDIKDDYGWWLSKVELYSSDDIYAGRYNTYQRCIRNC